MSCLAGVTNNKMVSSALAFHMKSHRFDFWLGTRPSYKDGSNRGPSCNCTLFKRSHIDIIKYFYWKASVDVWNVTCLTKEFLVLVVPNSFSLLVAKKKCNFLSIKILGDRAGFYLVFVIAYHLCTISNTDLGYGWRKNKYSILFYSTRKSLRILASNEYLIFYIAIFAIQEGISIVSGIFYRICTGFSEFPNLLFQW
jgi:hypothetical protein